jgi:hypothetical protein
MARVTKHFWWCGACGTRNESHRSSCIKCISLRNERYANVRAADRSVVFYNPATGEHRTPARADAVLPDVYAQRGFERREIESMSKWEKEAGVVHEATSFNPGNEPVPVGKEAPGMSSATRDMVINDIRDAIASGPWTGVDSILNSTHAESD